MSREGFSRQEMTGPSLPDDQIRVPNPGEIERAPQSRPPTWVWVAILVVGVICVMIMLYRTGARTGSFFILPMMGMSMLMLMRNRGGGDRKNRPAAVNARRAKYLRELDQKRDLVHQAARAQASEVAYRHPDPCSGSLTTLVGGPRMWEARPGGRNFGHVRLGVGLSRLKTDLLPPEKVPPAEYRETVTAVACRDFLLAQAVIHDVPAPLHLADEPGWAFFADPAQRGLVQGLLRALICQLCVFHGPDDVQLAIITDDRAAWEWSKWLPHVADPELVDASGAARLIFGDVAGFMERFGPQLQAGPDWAVRISGGSEPDRGLLVVVVDLPGADIGPIVGYCGRAGVSVLEATGNDNSILATRATAYQVDEFGDLLKAPKEEKVT